MVRWREGVDVLDQLARAGFSSYVLRKGGYIGQSELQRIRRGGLPSWKTLDWICNTLYMNVGELLEFIREGEAMAPGDAVGAPRERATFATPAEDHGGGA